MNDFQWLSVSHFHSTNFHRELHLAHELLALTFPFFFFLFYVRSLSLADSLCVIFNVVSLIPPSWLILALDRWHSASMTDTKRARTLNTPSWEIFHFQTSEKKFFPTLSTLGRVLFQPCEISFQPHSSLCRVFRRKTWKCSIYPRANDNKSLQQSRLKDAESSPSNICALFLSPHHLIIIRTT